MEERSNSRPTNSFMPGIDLSDPLLWEGSELGTAEDQDGTSDGILDGRTDGSPDGTVDGFDEANGVGAALMEGDVDGDALTVGEWLMEGDMDGAILVDGIPDGLDDGIPEGAIDVDGDPVAPTSVGGAETTGTGDSEDGEAVAVFPGSCLDGSSTVGFDVGTALVDRVGAWEDSASLEACGAALGTRASLVP